MVAVELGLPAQPNLRSAIVQLLEVQEALDLAAESVNGVANLKDQLEKIKNSV